MKRIKIVLITAALIGSNLFAVKTMFFSSDSSDFYEKGDQSGISMDQNNMLSLAPGLEKLEGLNESYVWDMHIADDGTLYAATGHSGLIYKMEGSNSMVPFFRIDNTEVSAITSDKEGNIYAAGIPKAVLYKITPQGEGKILKLLPDNYIWDMVTDENGYTYIACGGETARIYKMSPQGEIQLFLEIFGEEHVGVLNYDKEKGLLYAGTEGRGLLLEIQADGTYDVLYDTPETEVHDIVVDKDGSLLFCTASREKSYTAAHGQGSPQKNSLYKYDRRGVVSRLFYFNSSVILSLEIDENGNIFIGVGDEAKAYMLDQTKTISQIAKLADAQILSMEKSGDGVIYAGTGTSGGVYKMNVVYSSFGSYVSGIMDTYNLSYWGSVKLEGDFPEETQTIIETRSGDISQPDFTWSEFKPLTNGKIQSPAARFIQYRVIMKTFDESKTPLIKHFALSYIPANGRPEIYDIKLYTKPADRNGDDKSKKKTSFSKDQAMLSWNYYDPNSDSLLFDVYYKRADEKEFKEFKEGVFQNHIIFEKNRVPSGVYYFKVVVSDEWDNSVSNAMISTNFSGPMKLDHSAPNVSQYEVITDDSGKKSIKLSVEDRLSIVSALRCSVNGGDWKYIDPIDGLFDESKEDFLIELEDGAHSVSFQVADGDDNIEYYPYVIED